MGQPPRFLLKFTNPLGQPEELTIDGVIVPDMVMQGCAGRLYPGICLASRPPVSGIEEVDAFIQEVLEYQINDGYGYQQPDSGTIETFRMAGMDVEPVEWRYTPPEEEP